ncbi:hypothetical protein SEA_REYNAULD_71 [Rhodococcus phage Reynauld]|uniref:Uncharacterized protein n=1 Tax=Rhodococcus phage Reynauld TaxID=3062845 RepID=A0ACD4UHK2_9CAUD|nr:hypothetical protein SEA_REYNAULD_71 [Rhodococcus phage Reynauld]
MIGGLKTPEQWCELLGKKIIDPDGWRGADGRPWTDPVDYAEFQRRANRSTQMFAPHTNLDLGAAGG